MASHINVFFCRRVRGILPTLTMPINIKMKMELRELGRKKTLQQMDGVSVTPTMELGTEVVVWNNSKRKFTNDGVIESDREEDEGISYDVSIDGRSRRHLRQKKPGPE